MKYLFEMPNELAESLRQYAFENRKAKSVVCREALEAYLNLASLVPKIKGSDAPLTRMKKSKVVEPDVVLPEKAIVAGKPYDKPASMKTKNRTDDDESFGASERVDMINLRREHGKRFSAR